MSIKIKEFAEILLATFSLTCLIGGAGFWLAGIQIRKESQFSDANLAARFQKQYDRNKIKIGILEMDLRSVKKFLRRELGFHEREEFPENALPSEVDDTQDFGELNKQ